MSEAELHVLKERLYQAKLNKLRRGELLGRPIIGYIQLPRGEWAIDPDEQVQAVVRLICDEFDRQISLHAVLRYLVRQGIRIPVRPHCGPNRGQLEWRRPHRTMLLNILHHPAYAGTYRYGYRQTDSRRKQPGRPSSGRRVSTLEECPVLIPDRVPAYITWDRYLANQQHLADNRRMQMRGERPQWGGPVKRVAAPWPLRVPNAGALLRGQEPTLVRLHTGSVHVDAEPICRSTSAAVIDELVAEQILLAVAPAALEVSLAAVAGVERECAALAKQWQLRRSGAVRGRAGGAEGFRPPRLGKRFTAGIVLRLLARLGLPRCGRYGMLTAPGKTSSGR